ncbi:unnamed protein product [Phyllotreta striolata]|uniref:UDP-glucuronosyltransferase n=1 Tax=Phyllotreta striolata TaxID=444603 RepID=A0A9P0DS38_PHYSR|nr:unnamed protein product [Phyllotreta striolata]
MLCNMKLLIFIVLMHLLYKHANSSRILGIFPSPGYSQYIVGERLMGALATRGHQVTVISERVPSEKIENYEIIRIKTEKYENKFDLTNWSTKNTFQIELEMFEICNFYTEELLKLDEVQELIHSNRTFDLVIAETFVNDALMAFAEHFNAPLVILSTQPMNEWSAAFVGNVRLPSINPMLESLSTSRMSFLQRLRNFMISTFETVYKELFFYGFHQKLVDKYFPNKIDLMKVIRNVELLLVYGHPLTTEPSLITSAVVEVAGFHVLPKKLPERIQAILDGASNGAILVSLGSNIPCHKLTEEQLKVFLGVFSKLPQRVLWKCELDIPDKPKNLFNFNWLPQSDVLAHPNTIAFVTHNGLLSTTEAMYHGVPMISVPVFSDQRINAARAIKLGVAEKVDFLNIKESYLLEAIQKITQNPKYMNKMKELSQMFRDQPTSPLDRAVKSVEYVLKYRPGKYFRSPAMDLYWFQLYLLDVVLFIFSVIVLVCSLMVFIIRKICFKKSQKVTLSEPFQKKQQITHLFDNAYLYSLVKPVKNVIRQCYKCQSTQLYQIKTSADCTY